jgi:hypothetical protein
MQKPIYYEASCGKYVMNGAVKILWVARIKKTQTIQEL